MIKKKIFTKGITKWVNALLTHIEKKYMLVFAILSITLLV